MNQRASHFKLGTTSQNYGSVYVVDYPPKQVDTNSNKGPNPFRSSSLNSGDKGSFTTTNKMLYRAWDNVDKAKLDDDKLKQLKNHHFKLGSYNPADVYTTNKIYHDKKPLTGQASKNQEESKNKMRAHYHDFKQQNFTNYKSTYANQYTPKDGEYSGIVGATHTENAICFGSHQLPMVTTNNASFTPKSLQSNIKMNNPPTLGIKLGDKSEPMETINQHYYTKKQLVRNQLPESTMKQLRSTHFNLGGMPHHYQTQNDYYKNTQNKAPQKLTYQIPVYQSGTWVDKQAKFNSYTTNKNELPPRETKPFERAVQVTRSGIDFGGYNSGFKSQFKSNYQFPNNSIKNQVEINKKSNVVIGTDTNNYLTQHKSSYKTNDIKDARVNVDIKKLSKEDHFHIGGQARQAQVTVYQDQHRTDIQNRNKLFHKENNNRS